MHMPYLSKEKAFPSYDSNAVRVSHASLFLIMPVDIYMTRKDCLNSSGTEEFLKADRSQLDTGEIGGWAKE